MKAITIRNPWALWILWGWKTIEARAVKPKIWQSYAGERIAIHASKLMDPQGLSLARPYLTEYQWEKTLEELELAMSEDRRKITDPRFGTVLCTAFAAEHRRLTVNDELYALCDCTRFWGLTLSDIRVLSRPLPWQGTYRVFSIPDEFIEEAY